MSTADPWERFRILSSFRLRTRFQRYAFAVLAVAVATALRFALQWLLGSFQPTFILFYPTVVIVAMVAGFWPGILASALSASAGGYFFLEPRFSFTIRTPQDVVGPVLFAFIGVFLTILTHSRNQAQRALRVSETDLNRAQAVAHVGSWLYDMQKCTLVLSDEACRIVGLQPRSPVTPQEMMKKLHPDDLERILAEWNIAIKCGAYDAEERMLVEGGTRWVRIRAGIEYDAEGRPLTAVGTVQDITEQKRAGAALRDSEDRYRDLVEHSEDLLCTHDLEGRLLSVNPAPARILGYTVDELLKIPMRELIIPEGRELFDAYLERLRTTGAPEKGLLCVITRSGEVRTWQFHNTLRTDGVNQPMVRGMAHDITEQRRAELASQNSELRYRLLFEKNIAGVAIASPDGRVLDCNDGWARILGYDSADEVRGHLTSDFYCNPADRQPILDKLRHDKVFYSREIQLRRKDGSPVWVLFTAGVLRANGSESVLQGTMIDISERKRAEEALRASEERFRSIYENSTIGIYCTTPDGQIVLANPSLIEMLGFSSFSELSGRNLQEEGFQPGYDRAAFQHRVGEAGEVKGLESSWTRKDGTAIFVRESARAIRNAQGRITHYEGTVEDVTERKRAEETVRQNEERFRVALKDSPITVFNQDRSLRYTWVYNPNLYWRKEIVGQTDEDILGAERATIGRSEAEGSGNGCRRARRGCDSSQRREVRYRYHPGALAQWYGRSSRNHRLGHGHRPPAGIG